MKENIKYKVYIWYYLYESYSLKGVVWMWNINYVIVFVGICMYEEILDVYIIYFFKSFRLFVVIKKFEVCCYVFLYDDYIWKCGFLLRL